MYESRKGRKPLAFQPTLRGEADASSGLLLYSTFLLKNGLSPPVFVHVCDTLLMYCTGVHQVRSAGHGLCVSSEETMHRTVGSMHASGLPDNISGCCQWSSCPSLGSQCTSMHNKGLPEFDSLHHRGAVRGYGGSTSRDLRFEASSPKHSSSHNSTVCSSQGWVNVESDCEICSNNMVMPTSEGSEASTSAAEYSRLCAKGICTLSQRPCHMRLTRESMQLLSREQYVQHVHGRRLSNIVDQIHSVSPFNRFVLAT